MARVSAVALGVDDSDGKRVRADVALGSNALCVPDGDLVPVGVWVPPSVDETLVVGVPVDETLAVDVPVGETLAVGVPVDEPLAVVVGVAVGADVVDGVAVSVCVVVAEMHEHWAVNVAQSP